MPSTSPSLPLDATHTALKCQAHRPPYHLIPQTPPSVSVNAEHIALPTTRCQAQNEFFFFCFWLPVNRDFCGHDAVNVTCVIHKWCAHPLVTVKFFLVGDFFGVHIVPSCWGRYRKQSCCSNTETRTAANAFCFVAPIPAFFNDIFLKVNIYNANFPVLAFYFDGPPPSLPLDATHTALPTYHSMPHTPPSLPLDVKHTALPTYRLMPHTPPSLPPDAKHIALPTTRCQAHCRRHCCCCCCSIDAVVAAVVCAVPPLNMCEWKLSACMSGCRVYVWVDAECMCEWMVNACVSGCWVYVWVDGECMCEWWVDAECMFECMVNACVSGCWMHVWVERPY